MSNLKIIYKEPEDRPIKMVVWGSRAGAKGYANLGVSQLQLSQGFGDIYVPLRDAEAWAEAVLKMVRQRRGN